MENRDLDFLSEIRKAIASLSEQIEELGKKVEEYQHLIDSEAFEAEPIDLDMDEVPEDDLPAGEAQDIVAAPVASFGEETQSEEPLLLDEPVLTQEEPEPASGRKEEHAFAEVREAVIDAMAQKQPWRTDMPGSPVKDIRSAISLNDRILFINTLFGENPMTFQAAVAAINSMESLDEVVDYVQANFPQWNMESEIVYRFMMAARRRVK
ncbi:MAG: hypothetical protein ACI3ZL_09875 [Candidatus Cryptobacteroides sp.]